MWPLPLAGLFVSLLLAGCSTSSRIPANIPEANTYFHSGTKIHFNDLGKGRPMLFIHGFGASIDTWRFIVDPLKNDYRLILIDLKGHGYSDRPRDSRYSLEDQAEIVTGLMRYLKLSEVAVVGHSLGAAIAVLAALKAQKSSGPRIPGIVLLAGSLNPERLPLFLRLLRFSLIGWPIIKLTPASFRTRMVLRKSVYDKGKITEPWVELYAKYQRIPGTDYALLETARQMIPPDPFRLREEARSLEIPVLNILGEHDEVIPREIGEGTCRLLPRCTTAVVEGVGHIPHEEEPAKVIPLIRDFVDKIL